MAATLPGVVGFILLRSGLRDTKCLLAAAILALPLGLVSGFLSMRARSPETSRRAKVSALLLATVSVIVYVVLGLLYRGVILIIQHH
jgi:hypothetical protein